VIESNCVIDLDPGERVGCKLCGKWNPEEGYGFGEAFLAGAGHPPWDGNANYICRDHLDPEVDRVLDPKTGLARLLG